MIINIVRLVVVWFILSTCSSRENTEILRIDGSSTLYPVTEAIIKYYGFENNISGFSIDVSGSNSGINKLCSGDIEIANSSRKITEIERNQCIDNGVDLFELPIAKDGIAIVVHSQNDWVDYLTISELNKIWSLSSEDKITRWNDIRESWPSQPIRLFGPTSNSGTYDYFFVTVLNMVLPPRGDYVASEDDEYLGKSIANDINAIGLFGLAYYKKDLFTLKLVPIDDENDSNGVGAITPSERTVMNNSYQPFIRELYLYINKDSLQKDWVARFVEYYILHAIQEVRSVGYIPEENSVYANQLRLLQDLRK
jgi:phosphate transport system substrate-binding protein